MRRDGIHYGAGDTTVIELLERYIALKQGVRYNTRIGYKYVLEFMKKAALRPAENPKSPHL